MRSLLLIGRLLRLLLRSILLLAILLLTVLSLLLLRVLLLRLHCKLLFLHRLLRLSGLCMT